jgi:hypothetical protein
MRGEHVLTLGYGPDNDVWPVSLLDGAQTSRIADPREVRGLGIDPAADYGPTSLEQFRAGAENVSDLREMQEEAAEAAPLPSPCSES